MQYACNWILTASDNNGNNTILKNDAIMYEVDAKINWTLA